MLISDCSYVLFKSDEKSSDHLISLPAETEALLKKLREKIMEPWPNTVTQRRYWHYYSIKQTA